MVWEVAADEFFGAWPRLERRLEEGVVVWRFRTPCSD